MKLKPMNPNLEGKILVVQVAGQYDPYQVLGELVNVFPGLQGSQLLFLPPEWEIRAMPVEDAMAQLKGILRRLEVANGA